jgi:hypothetical protein
MRAYRTVPSNRTLLDPAACIAALAALVLLAAAGAALPPPSAPAWAPAEATAPGCGLAVTPAGPDAACAPTLTGA